MDNARQQDRTSGFTSRPGESAGPKKLRIIRCPSNRPIGGIVVSDDLVCAPVHYFKRRTKKCDGAKCEACEAGSPIRWKGYVEVLDVVTSRPFLLELPGRASEDIAIFREKQGSLRGYTIHVEREGKRINSPVTAWITAARSVKSGLPEQTNIVDLLLRMWEVRPDDFHKIFNDVEEASMPPSDDELRRRARRA